MPEYEAAVRPSLRDRARYPKCHFDHGPKWPTHNVDGDAWFGFESICVLPGIDPEILLIPLVGHSRWHAGIAVRDGDGWLLHCGDAYFNQTRSRHLTPAQPGWAHFRS